MLRYANMNVNPKNRKTADCSTRAIVATLGISYENALNLQCKAAIKTCYGITTKEVIEAVLKEFGWEKMKQPKRPNGKKYLVRELDEILTPEQMKNGVLVTMANHCTCVKDGELQDTWNCGCKSVGNYFVKVRDVNPPCEKDNKKYIRKILL